MERLTTTAIFDNYAEKYYMLMDYPPQDLMREIVEDSNKLINYVLAYVINTGEQDNVVELPKFLEHTLQYIVNFRASNFSTAEGGIIDMNTMISIKAQVNALLLEFIREISGTPFWFNHHLKLINAHFGSTDMGMPVPSLGVMVELGEKKLGELDYSLSHSISPQVLTALEMLVLRYETSN